VLLWFWISFLNPHRTMYGAASDLPWALAAFCAMLAGCLFAAEPRRIQLNAVTGLMLLLMVCMTITSLQALGPPSAVWAKWSQVEKSLLALILTASLLTDRRRLHALIWIMVISIGYYGVRGGLFTVITAGNFRIYGPPSSMIEDNNHLAAAMLVALPLMNYLRMQSMHRGVRWALLAAMSLTLLAVLGSYSRGALLGLVATAFILCMRSRHKIVSALVLAACIGGAIGFMPERWTQRMETLNTYEADESANDRLIMWQTGWKLAVDRPLLGSGFTGPYDREVVNLVDPLSPARAVHSIWFEFLGEHGFPSFVVWFGIIVAGVFYTLRMARLTRGRADLAWAHDLARMAQVSIVAYLVSGTFLSLSYWDFFWTLLVIIAASHGLAMHAVRNGGATGVYHLAKAGVSSSPPLSGKLSGALR